MGQRPKNRILAVVLAMLLCLGMFPQMAFAATLPNVTDISPSSGPTTGGTTVTLTGWFFDDVTKVTIAGNDVNFTCQMKDTIVGTITFTTPAHAAGTVLVQVYISIKYSDIDFTYTDPTYTITHNVAGNAHTFPAAVVGYGGAQTPLTVAITNTGNTALTGGTIALTTGASFTLSKTTLAATAPYIYAHLTL